MENMTNLNIERVEEDVRAIDVIPGFKYEITHSPNLQVSSFAKDLYEDLLDFIKINEPLIAEERYSDKESFIKGGRNMLAIVHLWIESTNLEEINNSVEQENNK